jgi:hypothetical protein
MVERVSDSCAHGFEWIREVEVAKTIEEIRGLSNKFPGLESRSAVAIKKAIKRNEISSQKMTRLMEIGHQTGKRVPSREYLWHMYRHLDTHLKGETLYDTQDLFAVKLGASKTKCNEEELERFLIRWDTVVTGMKKQPHDDTMHTLFFKLDQGD